MPTSFVLQIAYFAYACGAAESDTVGPESGPHSVHTSCTRVLSALRVTVASSRAPPPTWQVGVARALLVADVGAIGLCVLGGLAAIVWILQA